MTENKLPIKGFKTPVACDYDPLKQVFFLLDRSSPLSTKGIILTDARAQNIEVQSLSGSKYTKFLYKYPWLQFHLNPYYLHEC